MLLLTPFSFAIIFHNYPSNSKFHSLSEIQMSSFRTYLGFLKREIKLFKFKKCLFVIFTGHGEDKHIDLRSDWHYI